VVHLVMIEEAQEALAVQTETESQEEMAVVNIVMVTGFAQNVAIRILHGGKNVIAVMRQSPMMEMEVVEADQEIQAEVGEDVLEEVADQTEVKDEISHVEVCEEVTDQEEVGAAVLIVNVHINFQMIFNLKLFN